MAHSQFSAEPEQASRRGNRASRWAAARCRGSCPARSRLSVQLSRCYRLLRGRPAGPLRSRERARSSGKPRALEVTHGSSASLPTWVSPAQRRGSRSLLSSWSLWGTRHDVRSTCDSERPTMVTHGQSWSLDGCRHERAQSAFALVRALETSPQLVVRDRIELSTFRFSGGRSYQLSYLTWLGPQ
jgi:hypothetical protein